MLNKNTFLTAILIILLFFSLVVNLILLSDKKDESNYVFTIYEIEESLPFNVGKKIEDRTLYQGESYEAHHLRYAIKDTDDIIIYNITNNNTAALKVKEINDNLDFIEGPEGFLEGDVYGNIYFVVFSKNPKTDVSKLSKEIKLNLIKIEQKDS